MTFDGPRPLRLLPHEPKVPGLDALYRTYASYVAAVAFRLLGRDAEVDDIVQEVFVAATRGLDRIRDPAAVKPWLATVAARLSMRCLRRRRWRGFLGLDSATENDIAATPHDPATRVLLARVYAALDELSAKTRVAWALHHVEGETLPAVARMCGCSLATVKRRIAEAQQRIEERLT